MGKVEGKIFVGGGQFDVKNSQRKQVYFRANKCTSFTDLGHFPRLMRTFKSWDMYDTSPIHFLRTLNTCVQNNAMQYTYNPYNKVRLSLAEQCKVKDSSVQYLQ